MQLYAGGTLAGTSELYSSGANRAMGEQLGFWMPAVQFVRLPYYALLLKPLTILPYHTAYVVFQGACLAAALAFAFLARTSSHGVPWFLLISIPVLTGFANGQDVMIVLALSAAAVYNDQAKRPVLAGLCLAFCTIKFHLFVFTPISLLMHRKWRFAASAVMGIAIELAISFAVAGWHWPIEYAEFLTNPVLHPAPYVLPNVYGIAGAWVPLRVLLTVTLAVSTVYLCHRANSFPAAFTLCVFAGLLAGPHSYIQDYALLLLIPLFLQPDAPLVRQLSLVLLSPFPYFLLMLDRPGGVITPVLLLLWFVALAADSCGLFPRRKTAEPASGRFQWSLESLH